MRDGLARSFDKEALVVLLLPGRAKWETMKFLDRYLDFATFHNRTAERGLNLPRMLPAKHRKVNQIREPGCYELLTHMRQKFIGTQQRGVDENHAVYRISGQFEPAESRHFIDSHRQRP